MYRAIQTFLVALCLLVSCLATGLRAQEDIRPLVDALGASSFPQKIEAVKALAASGDPKVAEILQNLSDGKLYAPQDRRLRLPRRHRRMAPTSMC